MAEKKTVTQVLAVLVGITLAATAFAAPRDSLRDRAAKEPSFLELILSLFRADERETQERPKVRKSESIGLVTGSGLKPHQSSLRTMEPSALE